MKVLMFGWEFPPHISGGLGTACYGLTKGLSAFADLDLIFVVPKLHGDEDNSTAELISADSVPIKNKGIDYSILWSENKYQIQESASISTKKENEIPILKELDYIEIRSLLQPYLSAEEFEVFLKEKNLNIDNVKIDEDGRFFYIKDGVPVLIKELTTSPYESEEEIKIAFSGKYGANLMQEVANYAKVAALIASTHKFDIIHAHDWLTYAAGIAAKQISGKPLVVHVHATEFDRGGEYHINSEVFALEKAGMENADRVITVSNLTRNTVINRYGIDPKKVITVYNAVEPQEAEYKDFKKNVDEKIVTFLGRITYQKGPEYFVTAAAKVLKRVDNVRFVMAGSGDLFRDMIKFVAKLKIADKFHFTDFLKGEDVTHMFAISDVYVMPSISEPFGISPLEAMRSNVPVIISKQSGVAEVLTNAVKVDFWDDDAIADAIYGLIRYEGLTKEFKENSKTEVDNIKWEKPAKEVHDIYKNLFFKEELRIRN
jgi:glycosyltransferase involved in cell wall biosynthesis